MGNRLALIGWMKSFFFIYSLYPISKLYFSNPHAQEAQPWDGDRNRNRKWEIGLCGSDG
jgi:hypothetical protein